MATDVLLGDLAEALRAGGAERDRHLPVTGRVRIRLDARIGELVAREQRALLDDEGNALFLLALAIEATLVEQLGGLGQTARDGILG